MSQLIVVWEPRSSPGGLPLAEIAKYRAIGDYSGSFGARVANCSSCGFAGRLL
jgi:hypothetical protein